MRAAAGDRRWVVAARAGLALSACCALALARQLYTSGAPLPGVRGSGIYPLTALAALGLAAWALLGASRRAPVAAGALALAVFVSNDRSLSSGDTHGASLLPYRIIRNGSLTLDGMIPSPPPYWVVERGGQAWSRYPVAAAVLALPVYLPVALGPGRPGALPQAEKVAASLLCAISVGFVLAAVRRAGAPPGLAAAATALYALASPVLSTASQALWQHGPGVLGLSGAIWAALRAREDDRWAALAGLSCGVAVAARPTNAILAAGVVAAVGALGVRRLALTVAGALPPLVLVAAYQSAAFGSPLATGYGAEASAFTTPLGAGLRAVLLSPTRGLLAYVPWAAVAAVGLARGARRDPLAAGLAVSAAATVALYAKWHAWWGGWCYGPRMLADLAPVLALGIAYTAPWPRRVLVPLLAATGLTAFGLNALGAFAWRSPAAQAVYDVDDGSEAMEGWRWPLARLVGVAARK